jgi:hypothetical protein
MQMQRAMSQQDMSIMEVLRSVDYVEFPGFQVQEGGGLFALLRGARDVG